MTDSGKYTENMGNCDYMTLHTSIHHKSHQLLQYYFGSSWFQSSSIFLYTIRRDSSLHCKSSSKAAIQLYKDSSTLVERKIYSGVSCFFWECRSCFLVNFFTVRAQCLYKSVFTAYLKTLKLPKSLLN